MFREISFFSLFSLVDLMYRNLHLNYSPPSQCIQSCNQYDRSIKKKCEAILEEMGNTKKPSALPDASLPIKKRKRREEKQEEGDLSMNYFSYAQTVENAYSSMISLKKEENVDEETGCTTVAEL